MMAQSPTNSSEKHLRIGNSMSSNADTQLTNWGGNYHYQAEKIVYPASMELRIQQGRLFHLQS
jgi:hypothetical protein